MAFGTLKKLYSRINTPIKERMEKMAQGNPSAKKSATTRKSSPAANLVKDPVCGMEIDPEVSSAESFQGKDYYFCSSQCVGEFRKDPTKFVRVAS